MIKIDQRSYTRAGEDKQLKGAKFVEILDGNLSVKNAPKLSAKYWEDKISKSDPKDIHKSGKISFRKN